MGLIEVLINENLADNQQLIIDKGTLSVPTADDNKNYGPLNISGGSNYLLTMFDKFSQIKGYTMCNYRQRLSNIAGVTCDDLPTDQFSLSPFTMKSVTCGSQVVNADEKSKLDFICNRLSFQNDTFLMAILGLILVASLFCICSLCIFCRYRAKEGEIEIAELHRELEGQMDPQMERRIIEE